MKTYQDSLNQKPLDFIFDAIKTYQTSDMYEWAVDGDNYVRQKNTTIMKYKKLIYDMAGKAVPDNYSANHKTATNFFNRFCTQLTQYLLKNGVSFQNDDTKEKLGGAGFDKVLKKAGKLALSEGVAYGFYNLDHIEVFKASEFVPLYDEETGALRAGIKFWQLETGKPLRATYYEEDGFTEYIWEDGQGAILKDKQSYIQVVRENYDGLEILEGKNYPSFPIVPLWSNPEHNPELVGLKEEIDAFDLIKSGFANDLDDASQIYWIIQNAGGMEENDLARFIERIKVNRAVNLDSDQSAEAHTIEVPYNARETYLERLENDMYKDAMIVNMDAIASGNTVATAIRASYEPQDNKADEFEDCIDDFIEGILALIGIEDTPSFTRSRIINQAEETNMILASAQYLDDETLVRKLPFITADEVDDILEKRGLEEYGRFGEGEDGQTTEGDGEGTPEDL
jgi:SPP1 family phage portal protein